jgi:adenine-specific DNA-methyltransferase
MNEFDSKQSIATSLAGFANKPLAQAAVDLLESLGYRSQKRLVLPSNTPAAFASQFAQDKTFPSERALLSHWQSVDFVFQLTGDEIRAAAGDNQQFLFDSKGTWDGAVMESYLFFAISLSQPLYTRTQLANITRAVNRLFPMPVMLLFRHGETLTLSVINRRLHKREQSKDVLEKVTLIKDIRLTNPHRAHIEILFDLSFDALRRAHEITNFVSLHRAWQETLDIQALNKRFFIEVRNWFYWARLHARFPEGARKDADNRDSEALIRLLTRMIFCWFLREKHFIPSQLFHERSIEALISDWHAGNCESDRAGRYYKAILQNLFFATLNTPVEDRKFRSARTYQGKNKHYGDQRYFRHDALFRHDAPVEDLYKTIPFLNGGLFEMLDEIPGRGDDTITEEKRVDGFSDVPGKQPVVPDFLFFGKDRPVPEIGALLGESSPPHSRGLFNIFRDYKFTIEENTPLEQDIALDPELLGRAFENLLAAVNPETGTVARKSTGSFYTPREIVNYMVEEAIFRRLLAILSAQGTPLPDLADRLRELISAEKESHRFDGGEADTIVRAIGQLRILDPACGSGAFPMGLLQRLVHVLHKLDRGNQRWKAAKLASLPEEMRQKAEVVFREESFDYTRKLELIRDCIHGVDIQPAAIQISKLRFFLSLAIEQNDPQRVRPLPNLETKFVCANSLLGLPLPEGWDLFHHQIEPHERALLDVRARYFFALPHEKEACRIEDGKLRKKLGEFIEQLGGSAARQLASAVAAWDPYKPDRVAGYFDPESMFGVSGGFDITIGNPPYVRADEQSEWNQRQRQQIVASNQFETLWEKWDLFVPFIERAYKLLKPDGVTTLIVSDAFCHSKYAQKPQNWFLKNARILRLDFCTDLQIFDAAVHNLIYFFQRADGTASVPERRVHKEEFGNVNFLPSDEQTRLTYRAFFPETSEPASFAAPVIPIGQVCYVSFGCRPNSDEKIAKGLFVAADLVSERKDKHHPKPYIEAKDIARWTYHQYRWLEWGTDRSPELLTRPTFEQLYEVPEKIVAADVSGAENRAAYDPGHVFHSHTLISFVPWHSLQGLRNNSLKKSARYRGERPPRPDLPKREELEATSRRFAVKYLLGVMNSSAARDFLRAHRRSNIHLYPDDWKKLPVPDVPPAQQRPVVAIVDRILAAKRADPDADIDALEAELDSKASALYGITTTSPASAPASAPAPAFPRTKRTAAGMKELLRDGIIPKLSAQTPYFDIEAVRTELETARCPLEPTTLNSYMHELTEAQFIYDAGRSWYSRLATPFTLDRAPVSGLVQELSKAFPLVELSCWSTEQVKGAMHHLLSRFVAFVNVEADSMASVWEHLRDSGWDASLNPRGPEAARFVVRERTVVVRRQSRKSPSKEPFAPIETLLVELCFEARDLQLMAMPEFHSMLANLAGTHRIQMGTLLSYAAERKLPLGRLIDENNQLIPPFS